MHSLLRAEFSTVAKVHRCDFPALDDQPAVHWLLFRLELHDRSLLSLDYADMLCAALELHLAIGPDCLRGELHGHFPAHGSSHRLIISCGKCCAKLFMDLCHLGGPALLGGRPVECLPELLHLGAQASDGSPAGCSGALAHEPHPGRHR